MAFVCLTEEAIANGEMPSVMGGRGPFDLVVVEDVVDKLVQPLHLVHALPSLVRSSTGYAHSMTVTHSVPSMRPWAVENEQLRHTDSYSSLYSKNIILWRLLNEPLKLFT